MLDISRYVELLLTLVDRSPIPNSFGTAKSLIDQKKAYARASGRLQNPQNPHSFDPRPSCQVTKRLCAKSAAQSTHHPHPHHTDLSNEAPPALALAAE